MPKRIPIVYVALSSMVFTYLFFIEYLSPFRKVYIPFDLWGYHYPLMDAAFQSLGRLSFPTWDLSIYCGQPFAGNIQAALFYPPTWILYLVSAAHAHLTYTALEAFVFAHIWLAFLIFFCWLRNKGLADLACILGAGVFAYSGFTMLQLQHLGLICGYAWLPLGLWGIDDANNGHHWRGFFKITISSAACFLAGYPPTWVVLAIFLIAYAIFSRSVMRTVLALIVSLALSAVQLFPAIEASSMMLKENRYGDGIRGLGLFLAYLAPDLGREYLYLGAPALFGIAALFMYRLWRPIVPLAAAGFVCLVFLSNPFDVVSNLIGRVEFLSQICRDWYFLAGLTASFAALAAFGIDKFLASKPRELSRPWIWAAVAGAFIWAAYELLVSRSSPLRAAATLVIFTLGVFAFRSQTGRLRTALAVALLLGVAVDYKSSGTNKPFNGVRGALPHEYGREGFLGMDRKAFDELIAHPEGRILLDFAAPLPDELRHHGLASPQGFDPFISRQYLTIAKNLGARFETPRQFDFDIDNASALDALGVRYVITTGSGTFSGRLASSPKFRRLGSETSYLQVFEYRDELGSFGFEQHDGTAELLSRTPEIRRFHVVSQGGSNFILKEQFFPGWAAFVDGKPVPIQLWRGAFQSVGVPTGEHTLEFHYRSSSLKWGAWMSVLSILALAGVALLHKTLSSLFS
jgi:hypothetical protein